MPWLKVTCPETAHLEEIEYVDSPVGMLITSCTRFSPASAVTCNRECAARLDRKRRGADGHAADACGATTLVNIRVEAPFAKDLRKAK